MTPKRELVVDESRANKQGGGGEPYGLYLDVLHNVRSNVNIGREMKGGDPPIKIQNVLLI